MDSLAGKGLSRTVMAAAARLQAIYEDYLVSGLDPNHAASLVNELSGSGLREEAECLRRYLAQPGTSFVVQDGAWRGCSTSIQWTPPHAPNPGDLWFDVVELTTMVFIAEMPGFSADLRGWMATRPVQGWQFKGFLGVAKPKSRIGGDRFDTERFSEIDPMASVVDLHPDEAEAYALWFGKWSLGGLELQCAERLLTLERKKLLSPDGLLLWDLSPPSSGWYYAVGFQPDTGELLEEEFSDCDRDPRVGLATCAFLQASSRVKGWSAG
jgi:hypothetical protein